MVKILSILIAISTLTACASTGKFKAGTFLYYPEQIGVLTSCKNQTVSESIIISTNSKRPLKVFDLSGINRHFKIINKGKELTSGDTLLVDKDAPLELMVSFTNDSVAQKYQHQLAFKTNHPNYKENILRFFPNTLALTAKQIEAGGEIIVDKTQACLNTFSIAFPYGGTITTVNLYKTLTAPAIGSTPDKTISYMIFENNRIEFTAAETGTYFVDYSACHWGNDLKIIIK